MFTLACCPASSDSDTAESLRFYVKKFAAAKRAILRARVQVCTTEHISKVSPPPPPSFHGMTISQCGVGVWWGVEGGAVGGWEGLLWCYNHFQSTC